MNKWSIADASGKSEGIWMDLLDTFMNTVIIICTRLNIIYWPYGGKRRKFRTQLALSSRTCQHFNAHFNHCYRRNLQRRRTLFWNWWMIWREVAKSLFHMTRRIWRKIRTNRWNICRRETEWPELLRDRKYITKDDLLRAVSSSEETVSDNSPAVNLVEHFEERKMQSFKALVRKTANEVKAKVPDSEVWPTFAKGRLCTWWVYPDAERRKIRRRIY